MFFANPQKRFVKQAKELLEMAKKVLYYRKDLLSADAINEINSATALLGQSCIRTNFDAKHSEKTYEHLHQILKKHGGQIYPVTFFSDNIEMLLVTLILAIGLRTYFVQPMKIPTNSMWPTFHGMIAKIYTNDAEKPDWTQSLWNKITLGSNHYTVDAPANGSLMIPLLQHGDKEHKSGPLKFKIVQGRKWFGLLPDPQREYTFYIDKTPLSLRVPLEFNLLPVIEERFYSEKPTYSEYSEDIPEKAIAPQIVMTSSGPMLQIPGTFTKGQNVLDFDILSGDILFVDRLTYHFRKPKVGEPIVFRTLKIAGLMKPDGTPDDRYFIKRLVGEPGDILQIHEPVLMRNGQPITGSIAFGKNATREGLYPGYVNHGMLDVDLTVKIPQGYFFGMGDNSPGSGDSRSFGFIPEKELIGKALFIFYPFSDRWGVAP